MKRLLCWWITLVYWRWIKRTRFRNLAFEIHADRTQEPWQLNYSLKGRGTGNGSPSRRYFEEKWYRDTIVVWFDEVYPEHPREEHRVKNLEIRSRQDISVLQLLDRVSPLKVAHLKAAVILAGFVPVIALISLPLSLVLTYVPREPALQALGWWLVSLLLVWLIYGVLWKRWIQ